MRILFDIAHPAHVHFFKNIALNLEPAYILFGYLIVVGFIHDIRPNERKG